ncbi:TetR/AcrR family transcriptional regulator [Actinomycetospora sp. TBRC 11914]|uniref:TetR/AcrR family transcriptional regulator n=1 Tax=Actinomycetospora sp. TBRC 11914 TaxID=2729387 RepID=UPI00145F9FF3|nr:TetR/AcrR family transcriptional regulator [Actinomycetospora sp. TBRC 11914]NMO92524.1 TetR/AcrR family transcriptional regulator [Actinomycetospora sp. TBRC 11914]
MSAARDVVTSPDGATRRPGRAEPYTFDSLVEVAARAFLERGYDATSMEDLSRAAGITKSSFYHHVSGKEALLRGALDRALDGLFGVLAEPRALEGPPVARLRHIVRRQVEVLGTELPYVTLLLRLRGNTETERWALGRRREFDQAVAALVREATDAGATRPDLDPVVAARLLSGTVNSLIEWYRPERLALADLVDAVERQVFDGLLGG